jgi:hypothetical protein
MAQLVLATQRRRARLLATPADEASQSPPGTLGKWLEALGNKPDDIGSICPKLLTSLLTFGMLASHVSQFKRSAIA